MMQKVIDQFINIFSMEPDALLTETHLGTIRPPSASELPFVTMSLRLDNTPGAGLRNVLRSGELPGKLTNIVEVKASPDTFSQDLNKLKLLPPVRKNPNSTKREWTESDVEVIEVSGAPVRYTVSNKPQGKTEYRIDPFRAEISFGQPQTPGDKLQVSFWTITWRDDIEVSRFSGTVMFEISAENLNQLQTLSKELQSTLHPLRGKWRTAGFSKLRALSLDPAERILYQPPAASAFPLWKQLLGYQFVFEMIEEPQISSGIPIRTVDVDLEEPVAEQFQIPLKQ